MSFYFCCVIHFNKTPFISANDLVYSKWDLIRTNLKCPKSENGCTVHKYHIQQILPNNAKICN